MSIFRNDTLGSWTRGGQAIVHNLRMTTQVLFQTGIATLVIWVIGTLWYALEKSSAYERFVLTKIIEASFKADAALGTNDPVLFKTPSGEHYWTSADWLLASDLAKKTLHNFEVILIHGALISGLFALGALFWAWYYFTRTGKGLGSNEYLRGARFGTLRQIKRALWRQKKGSLVIGGVPVPRAFEPEHVLLCGAPGTGKTNLIVKMLDGIRKEGKRAIVYDTAGTFVEKFYRPGIDTLLNPLDARTARWSPWVDVPRDYHYDQIAESTIPDKSGDPFWAKAARGTLVAVLRKLAKQKHTFVSVLLDRLLRSKLKDLAAFVSGTDAAAFISTEGEWTCNGFVPVTYLINAPKSVSVMALVAGDERIIAAHEKAVGTALDYLEEHATLRRRDDGRIVHETTGRLIFARFTEHASRELDPHLHTHVVVMNMTNREDRGQMASLETRAMFAEQMVAGQIYRNDLAHRLRELGYEIISDPRSGLFEIRGVPAGLIRDFSQRAEQIESHAREHGLSGQAARREAFYATRPAKEKSGLDTLHAQWIQRSERHGETLAEIRGQADEKGERELSVEAAIAARATLFGIRQAETREAVNNLGRMIRLGLASQLGEVRLQDVRPRLKGHEEQRKLLSTREQTGDQVHTRGRTTRRSARLEQRLSFHLALALDDALPIASGDRLIPVLERSGLTPAQEQALIHVAHSSDRVTAVHGVAGAGKSTLVKALDEAAEPGTTLIAIAPTSSAAANLGQTAGIESRTVASLLARGGYGITASHVLVLDEAGQLGNRQALRMLEISRKTGARLILLGDDKQTGAIEQGKPFWLMQKLGMSTAQLTESMRQQTRTMKAAVTQARVGNYSGSLASLDKVVSGVDAEKLAEMLVAEWTRLKPENRANTNILVLENATRLIVNTQIRETLKREGVVAAEDTRLQVLTPTGMTDQEKHNARFYSGGQVVTFGRDMVGLGIARATEYRVLGIGRDANGRQIVRLVDEHGRIISWDPRLGKARQINVFNQEERNLAQGDRIQWRLVHKDLDLKNAERGTVERLDGAIATIRWDRDNREQRVDLATHKTWDHGYAETVYSAQSKTYDRAYVLAPVDSGLVNGQNYYTAITRARYGVKLWTEDPQRLAQKLEQRSGEKTSALEGLGRLERDTLTGLAGRHGGRLRQSREEQERLRREHRDRSIQRQLDNRERTPSGLGERLADNARSVAEILDRFLQSVLDRSPIPDRQPDRDDPTREDRAAVVASHVHEPSHDHDH